MKITKPTGFALLGLLLAPFCAMAAEQWEVFETSFTSAKKYDNPFVDVEVDVVFQNGDRKWVVPAFWTGGDRWTVRFAPPVQGEFQYKVKCSDASNQDLNGEALSLEVTAYTGDNPLYQHGKIGISGNGRHFQHADGTPFFWLGDTWWKCLSKRLTWEGFQELAADRKQKGFSVIQIVAGPYPDEGPFEPMWENEGGMPYHTRDYKQLNPEYWNFADRRLQHLIDSEMVPAIVGAWGRRDCDAMKVAGVEGLKRHWRYLIARYGAYPVVWILAGELHDNSKWGEGPWEEVGRYVRSIDPYQAPSRTTRVEAGEASPAMTSSSTMTPTTLPEAPIELPIAMLRGKSPAVKPPLATRNHDPHPPRCIRPRHRNKFWRCKLQ